MCAMALLHRAKALSKQKKHEARGSGHEAGLVPAEERMPARFIGQSFRAGNSPALPMLSTTSTLATFQDTIPPWCCTIYSKWQHGVGQSTASFCACCT